MSIRRGTIVSADVVTLARRYAKRRWAGISTQPPQTRRFVSWLLRGR